MSGILVEVYEQGGTLLETHPVLDSYVVEVPVAQTVGVIEVGILGPQGPAGEPGPSGPSGLPGAIQTVNGHGGPDVVLAVGDIVGAAPADSPSFTGIPTVNGVPIGGSLDGGNATSSTGVTIDGGSA